MSTTIVLQADLAEALSNATQRQVETAGVLLARVVTAPSGHTRLLAHSIHWVPDSAYEMRRSDSLRIRSDGFVPPLQHAEATGSAAIWLHTHPGSGSSPVPSDHDRIVDTQLSHLFRLRSGHTHYASVIVAHDAGALRFTGRVETDEGTWPIDRAWIVGSRFTLLTNFECRNVDPLPTIFDRSIRAFGGDIQRVLGEMHIVVVGCGGTGSSVVEQLARLGVRKLTLVDPDILSDSNVTRVYGSTPSDVGRAKVSVLADHCLRIAPSIGITQIQSMVTREDTARHLMDADLVFCCTDDNAGRLVLSRFSTYFLVPVIDCAVLLDGDTNGLHGIYGRVTILHPGAACLVCRNRIDLARARSEVLTPDERVRLEHEGYAPALGRAEPAVVAYTTMVASAAVGELLERLVHYGPEPAPTEILLRLHDRQVSVNHSSPRERHYCHAHAGKIGHGHATPFLEMAWSS